MAPKWPIASFPDMDRSGIVDIARWPADQHRRQTILSAGRGCLWLLAAGELAPDLGPGEDWIRVPADERDISARVQRLARRGPRPASIRAGDLYADPDGIVRWGRDRALLTPTESAIFNRLARAPGTLVTRTQITDEVWGHTTRSPRSLDSRIHVLRSKLSPLNLRVHTIRSRGFVLDSARVEQGERS